MQSFYTQCLHCEFPQHVGRNGKGEHKTSMARRGNKDIKAQHMNVLFLSFFLSFFPFFLSFFFSFFFLSFFLSFFFLFFFLSFIYLHLLAYLLSLSSKFFLLMSQLRFLSFLSSFIFSSTFFP